MKSRINIRVADRADAALILALIRELAEYEKLLHEMLVQNATHLPTAAKWAER